MPTENEPTDPEPFDLARYFDRVHRSPLYHQAHLGLARFAGVYANGSAASATVLDVGTGPGGLLRHLRADGAHVLGIDRDAGMLAKQRHEGTAQFVAQAAAEQLPFPARAFDVTVAGNLLFFLDEPATVLREMARVTRRGGTVAIWNPSEEMSCVSAALYAASRPDLDNFTRAHLVNWAAVAEANRRWSAGDLARLFAAADLIEFATESVLHGLARYGRGQVAG